MRENEVQTKPREAYDYINTRLRWPFATDKITDEQRRMTWTHYLATCSLIDDWVGRIVDTLKRRGVYENTIIMYSSDHGDLLGDHGLVYKQCFYEQSVRVPLIVHAPGRIVPRRIDEPVELMDLFSTICDYAEAEPGPGVQAKSLRPLLENHPDRLPRQAAFAENYFGRMVRHREWKMVYYPSKPYGEIYNLDEDPNEQDNLWDSLEGSRTKTDLKDLLLEWAFASEDPLPLPVRPDHMDDSPRQYELHHGGTREKPSQHWYLPWMRDLYERWEFSVDGRIRV
jgi:arylsulfatase A-like enzyme